MTSCGKLRSEVKEVMDELFSSELLKAILCGQFGDYGM